MLAREQFSTATAWGLDKAISLKLTVSMIPLPIGVALRHGGCRWAMA